MGILRGIVDANAAKTAQVNGADDFINRVNLSVADYAEKAGVNATTLRSIGEAFAASENGIILFGREFMFAMQNDPAVEAALNALVLLSGHFGKKDNGVIGLYAHNNSMGAVDMGVLPYAKPGREASAEVGLSAGEMGMRAKNVVCACR